jgi:hypothetical protein
VEAKDSLPIIIDHLSVDIGFGDPQRLANSLMQHLSADLTDEQRDQIKKQHTETENLRTKSVYVDFDQALANETSPSEISEETVVRWLENARLGIGMLRFLRAERPDLRNLIASMPAKLREEAESTRDKMIANLKARAV